MKKVLLIIALLGLLVASFSAPVLTFDLTDGHWCDDVWRFDKDENDWVIDCWGQSGPCYCLTFVL